MMRCLFCQKETENPKYCSQSCANSLNGRLFPRKRTKWSDEDLIAAIKECWSYAQVIRKLNLKSLSGNYESIKNRIKKLGLDISHFNGSHTPPHQQQKCKYPLCPNLTHRLFCSRNCNTKYNVTEWRRRTKLRAVEYKGGKCIRCGYNRSVAALEFHHRDPSTKEFGIAQSGNCISWDRIKLELDKCDLLCANCHREVEDH